MNRDYPGYFITFEGPEGSGKSTNIRLIQDWLERQQGLRVVSTREPGGTRIGDLLRDIVHDSRNTNITNRAEAWIYQASRAQLVGEVIVPALREGSVVLLDRYTDSSIAYQGYARGLGCLRVDGLNHFSTNGLVPDLTLLMDVDPKIGLARRNAGGEEINRMDLLPGGFHSRVRQAYLTLHQTDETGRWVYINAGQGLGEVNADIRNVLECRLIGAGILEGQISRERE